ncbi:autotransporter outer membrane beta-barrel domain-containing protein, partial [Agrobacterium tumefaciens]|uniref:autotransporter family protein n=1 Tax=Agrobacterium tumefaciens TaxID=358 RepID=UPI001B8A7731
MQNSGTISGGRGGTTSPASEGLATGNGGAGGHGINGSDVTILNSGTVAGAQGGLGGILNWNIAGQGGDGIHGDRLSVTNAGIISGGVGGDGSVYFSGSGPAGTGGAGIAGNDLMIVNTGMIAGGKTGAGEPGNYHIQGGPGIRGDRLTISNEAGGTISGGAGKDIPDGWYPIGDGEGISGSDVTIFNAGGITGPKQAITFRGGTNRLELHSGWSILGTVEGYGESNTLALGGVANGTFDSSRLSGYNHPAGGFYAFGRFEKTGSSTWSLTESTRSYTPWRILEGTLRISSNEALGFENGSLTLANGATLETAASMRMDREVFLEAGGGTFQVASSTTLELAGAVGGVGGLVKAGEGALLLSGAATHSGPTTLEAGTLTAGGADVFSAVSAHSVAANTTLDLNGFSQTLGSLDNRGRVAFGSNPGTVLTVSGNLTGHDGTILLNASLGGDDSPADMVNVGGDTAGSSILKVTNVGGLGDLTRDGIKVIDVAGASNGKFTLVGDYSLRGQPTIAAGAYGYQLHKGNATNAGDWYLRSQRLAELPVNDDMPEPGSDQDPVSNSNPAPAKPLYQAGVPLYETYARTLLGMNGLPTLQQRVGTRSWNTGSDSAPPKGIWSRTNVSNTSFDQRTSVSGASYSLSTSNFQAGLDGEMASNSAGSLVAGISVHYGRSSADIISIYGDGDINTDGYGFGSAVTWYGENGLYVDGQAQATWFDSDLSSRTASRNMASNNRGFGYTLGLETGARMDIAPAWSLTPQAQLAYSRASFDSFTDPFGARVSLDDGDSLTGRLGISLDYRSSWSDDSGRISSTRIYGITNLFYEFLDGTQTTVSGTPFASVHDRLWADVGFGGSFDWDDGKYSLYGEASVATDLTNS